MGVACSGTGPSLLEDLAKKWCDPYVASVTTPPTARESTSKVMATAIAMVPNPFRPTHRPPETRSE